jgi:hypothetical protein
MKRVMLIALATVFTMSLFAQNQDPAKAKEQKKEATTSKPAKPATQEPAKVNVPPKSDAKPTPPAPGPKPAPKPKPEPNPNPKPEPKPAPKPAPKPVTTKQDKKDAATPTK